MSRQKTSLPQFENVKLYKMNTSFKRIHRYPTMPSLFKLLCVALLLGLFGEGLAAPCTVSDIHVQQSKTGKVIEGQPEYEVVISNTCSCRQSNVKLQCVGGLSTVEPLDPAILKDLGGGKCLVKNGQSITQTSPVNFTYAWLTPSDLPPAESQIAC